MAPKNAVSAALPAQPVPVPAPQPAALPTLQDERRAILERGLHGPDAAGVAPAVSPSPDPGAERGAAVPADGAAR